MHLLACSIRRNSFVSTAKRISIILLMFSLPAIMLAQRWDKMATFPIAPSTNFFGNLSGLTSGPDGALWYTDIYRQVVGRMTTAGAVTEYGYLLHSSRNHLRSGWSIMVRYEQRDRADYHERRFHLYSASELLHVGSRHHSRA